MTDEQVRRFLASFKVHGEVNDVAALCRDWLVLHALLDSVARLECERDDERLLTAKYHQLVGATGNDCDDALRHLRAVLNTLPESEIEIARECWGNTNTRIVIDALHDARAFLAAHDSKSEGVGDYLNG